MFYGYKPTAFDDKLEKALIELMKYFGADKYGMSAYVENYGHGVLIRRITHYPKETRKRIVESADDIYTNLEYENKYGRLPVPDTELGRKIYQFLST